jgi:uncharacterized protein YciI
MANTARCFHAISATVFASFLSLAAQAQVPAPASAPIPPGQKLFAVEITTGAKWDTSKPPNQQAFMKEHSAHLKKLRDDGLISMGARYGDKGLIVLKAQDENEARAIMAADPSMQNETFKFSLHEMRVFYPGQVGEARKAP